MDFIKCGKEHTVAVTAMYRRSVRALEQTVNYPKWSDAHPGNDYIAGSILRGELFACIDNGMILGATVLSEDPEGNYELGEWKVRLKQGEFLVVHTLAVSPDHEREGVGSFLVDGCIAYAEANGYKAVRLDVVPENIPAVRLYTKKGFTYAGTTDLQRNIEYIPLFDLYEFNIK